MLTEDGAEQRTERVAATYEDPLKCHPKKVTQYYEGLIQGDPRVDPVGIQAIPSPLENEGGGEVDPLMEGAGLAAPGLLHVYRDRVLLLASGSCAVNCRHCNRRWTKSSIPNCTPEVIRGWVSYLTAHHEVEEVLVTGGDPLTLPTEAVEEVLAAVRSVPHIGVIRIGSRLPVVDPERVSERLAGLLARFHPVYLNTQFNCPAECTPEAADALDRLAGAGIVLGNQMVLLAGVNDAAQVIALVNRWLVRHRCRPYYLFLAEPVRGTMHLRVGVERAVEIAGELRRLVSGLAMPRVVVDTPCGGGKIPLEPSRLERRDDGWYVQDNNGRSVKLE